MAPPLTQQERAAIIETAFGAAEAAFFSPTFQSAAAASFSGVPTTAVGATVASFFPLLAFVPPALGLLAMTLQPSFPRLAPGEIGQVVQEAARLRSRGLRPQVETDPFTGNIALFTESQRPILQQLLAEQAARALPPSIPPEAIRMRREEVIAGLASSAEQRGFFSSLADVPEGLSGQFIRETAESPLRFVPLPPGGLG